MRSCYRALVLLVIIANVMALHAACSVTMENRDGVQVRRYTVQRISDYRPSTIHGFLDLVMAPTPETNGQESLLALPSRVITEVTTTTQGSLVIYELVQHGKPDRREVVIPTSLIRPEQVRLLVNQSLAVESISIKP